METEALKKIAAKVIEEHRNKSSIREHVFGSIGVGRNEAIFMPKLAGQYTPEAAEQTNQTVLPKMETICMPIKWNDDFIASDIGLMKEVHAELVKEMSQNNFCPLAAMTSSTAAGAEVMQEQATANLETFREMLKLYKYTFRAFTVSPKGYRDLLQKIPPVSSPADIVRYHLGFSSGDPFGGLRVEIVENQDVMVIEWRSREAMEQYIATMSVIRNVFKKNPQTAASWEYERLGYPLGKTKRGFKKWMKKRAIIEARF